MLYSQKGCIISGIHLTDFFNESGYLEAGGYRLKITLTPGPASYGPNNPIIADPTQLTGQSNGELIISLGDNLVWGVGFGARGLLGEFENHEYSVGGLEVNPVPEPATMLLLGVGLVGLAGFGRKKFQKVISIIYQKHKQGQL